MAKKMQYPKEQILIVRPSLKAICCQNKPASKLLSVLLYWYDHATEETPEDTFTVYRTQDQLVTDACDELTVKTLHDIAAPFLQALGYITIEQHKNGKVYYTVNIGRVSSALKAYTLGTLNDLLRARIDGEIEKFLIQIDPLEIEIFLDEIEIFLFKLEKLLFPNRNISNSTRGHKPRPEAAPEAKSAAIEKRESNRGIYREGKKAANAARPTRGNIIQPAFNLPAKDTEVVRKQDYPPNMGSAKNGLPPLAPPPNSENGHKPEKPPTIVLAPEAQAVFDEWCKMPWFKTPPALQSNDPEHLRKLAAYQPTAETMLKAKKWATSAAVDTNGWYKGKAWRLAFLAKELPNWLSSIPDETPAPGEKPARPSALVSEEQERINKERLHRKAEEIREARRIREQEAASRLAS